MPRTGVPPNGPFPNTAYLGLLVTKVLSSRKPIFPTGNQIPKTKEGEQFLDWVG